jgi:hypothetical protein
MGQARVEIGMNKKGGKIVMDVVRWMRWRNGFCGTGNSFVFGQKEKVASVGKTKLSWKRVVM